MKNEEKEVVVENEVKESGLKSEEKTFGMFCHLLAFAGIIGIPFGNVLGPLVMWLIKRNESAFVDQCGKESLNFQISITIYAIVSVILSAVLIGIPLLILVGILYIVCVIKASIKANDGETYTYPFSIRFIK